MRKIVPNCRQHETETVDDLQENKAPIVKYIKIGDAEERWYDEDGDLVKISDDWATQSIQYVTDSEGNKVCGDQMYENQLVSRIYNTGSVPMLNLSGEGMFSAWYNEKRHLIQSISYEYGGGGYGSDEFVYDAQNRLIKAKHEESTERSDLTNEVTFEYLEDGNKVAASRHYICKEKDGTKSDSRDKTVFNYSCNRLISFTAERGSFVPDESWEAEYDTNGNMVRERYECGSDVKEYKYQYDENGNEIRIEKNGTDGDEITEYRYDGTGNKIKRETSGTNHNCITEYQYDENGNLTGYISIDEYGKELKSTTGLQYDENGKETKCERIIEHWTYDEDGNMTQQTSSDEKNISEYDEDGKLISYAYLYSSTGNDVVSDDSQYLYDEQGRISEIVGNGETVVTVSYNETGMPEKIDFVMETDSDEYDASHREGEIIDALPKEPIRCQWQIIYDLLPQKDETMEFGGWGYWDIMQDIVIEYR